MLDRWVFDSIPRAGEDVSARGVAIEESGGNIARRCDDLPALRGWDGATHQAATDAFGRARVNAIALGEFGDRMSSVLAQGFWSLSTAKSNVVGCVADLEQGDFDVTDEWVVTIKPRELSAEELSRLRAERNSAQSNLNPLVSAVGAADDSFARALNSAAADLGFVPSSGDIFGYLAGQAPVNSGIPDPLSLSGLMFQQSVADADAAVTVAATVIGVNDIGEATTTLSMQDGSKKILTETATYAGSDSSRPMLREEAFDPEGKLISTTNRFQLDQGTEETSVRFADGTLVQTMVHPNGTRSGSVHEPGGGEREIPSDSAFFSHPELTTVGGLLSGIETQSGLTLQKTLTPWTDELVREIHVGSKYGGPALAIGVALTDVFAADSAAETCQASISGLASVAGGWGGGALGAMSPIAPLTSAAGSIGGSFAFGWLGSEIGKLVCY